MINHKERPRKVPGQLPPTKLQTRCWPSISPPTPHPDKEVDPICRGGNDAECIIFLRSQVNPLQVFSGDLEVWARSFFVSGKFQEEQEIKIQIADILVH